MRDMVRKYKRHRLYTVLAVLGIAGVVFLCFQFLSAEVLSLHSQWDAEHSIKVVRNMHYKDYQGGKHLGVYEFECVPGKDCPESRAESRHAKEKQNNKYRVELGELSLRGRPGVVPNLAERLKLEQERELKKLKEKQKNANTVKNVEINKGEVKEDAEKKEKVEHKEYEDDRDAEKGIEKGRKSEEINKGEVKEDAEKKEQVDHKEKKGDRDGEKGIEKGIKKGNDIRKDMAKVEKSQPETERGLSLEGSHPLIPRGVAPGLTKQYISDSEDMFTCLKSKEKIAFSRLNDDYCDCSDFSDEPGTSACPQSRFYCGFQLSVHQPHWVHSSKVNDGICDCCDGSDEWQNITLPDHVKLEDDKPYYGFYQTPCHDHCGKLRAQKERDNKLRSQGQLLRKSYVEQAKQASGYDTKVFGQDGAWIVLGDKCFELKVNVYTYKLCPFHSIEQISSHGPAHVIGRNPTWISQGAERGYKLLMKGGDNTQCPERKNRQSEVQFLCGLEDKFLTVHEAELCSYLITFSTPLACL